MTPEYSAPPDLLRDLSRWRPPLLVFGLLLLAACLVAAFFRPRRRFTGT